MEPGRAKLADFAAFDHAGGPTASTSWRSAASMRCSATCASCARRTPQPYWGPDPLDPSSTSRTAASIRGRALSPRPLAAAARPHPYWGPDPFSPLAAAGPHPGQSAMPLTRLSCFARALCAGLGWSRTAAQTATWALANFYRFGASEADVRRGLPVFARLLFSSDAAVVRLLVAPYASHACFAHARTRVHGSHRLLKRACICTRARAHAAAHASPCAPCPLAPLTLT